MVDILRARGIVTVFVRLHPLLDTPLDILARFGTVIRHGESRRCGGRPAATTATTSTGPGAAAPTWCSTTGAGWASGCRSTTTTCAGVGAADYYFFPCDHLRALHDAVGDRMHLAVAVQDGEVVGGNTFFEHDGIATGYVLATRRARNRYADELLYDEVRRFCKNRGDTIFHLGGGKGGRNDSLFEYKAGFSPGRHLFHTWRVVTDPEAYRRLVAERNPTADPDDMSGTFPPYR
jgi:hypothetical protein